MTTCDMKQYPTFIDNQTPSDTLFPCHWDGTIKRTSSVPSVCILYLGIMWCIFLNGCQNKVSKVHQWSNYISSIICKGRRYILKVHRYPLDGTILVTREKYSLVPSFLEAKEINLGFNYTVEGTVQ